MFSKFDKKEQLFLECQAYSSYSNIFQILNCATKKIIVVDEYADINFLDLIRNIKCQVILITRNSNGLSDVEINKYNNLTVIRNYAF